MKQDQKLIDRIRSFNRFYTSIIGLLDQHFLDSPFSLTEGRVLYEICNIEECSAKKIRERILIDEGYLSRILDSFVKRGLVKKILSSGPSAPFRGDSRVVGRWTDSDELERVGHRHTEAEALCPETLGIFRTGLGQPRGVGRA